MTFRVHLKAGEKIFINGAVLRADRKVSLEVLNDVAFLLEGNVMQPEDTTTPLRQLYFVIQTLLMDKEKVDEAMGLYHRLYTALMSTFRNQDVLDGLCEVHARINAGRVFDALRLVRKLFPLEAQIIGQAAGGPLIHNANEAREARQICR